MLSNLGYNLEQFCCRLKLGFLVCLVDKMFVLSDIFLAICFEVSLFAFVLKLTEFLLVLISIVL